MPVQRDHLFAKLEITCGSLLVELQEIWDEVGEAADTRESVLNEIQQECIDLYRRKVDHAYQCRAQLRQAIADSEAELAKIYSAMGEHPVHIIQFDQKAANLKEELNAVNSRLEDMRKKKRERERQFLEILDQINIISNELHQSSGEALNIQRMDQNDLSLKSLEALHSRLHALQKEKSDRLKMVVGLVNTLSSLCMVLGVDFKSKIEEIHPTLDDCKGTKKIDENTIQKLASTVESLKEIKIQRLMKLQALAGTMLELWNLMDTPPEEQHRFQGVTSKIAASEQEITEPNCLSIDRIGIVEAEVSRLELLKSSKMKDLILRRMSELEEICRKSHMIIDAQSAVRFSSEAIESGGIDPGYLLDQIELQISNAKEEAFSRKDILERVEKWMVACEEESWLEEYNRDDNRYNAGRGTHLMLKRAEKARAMVTKIPSMVDVLTQKTKAWEKERGTDFLYDGVQLISMLEQYSILRQEKELEKLRKRNLKKLQGQLLAEQEALFGSKPSPTKTGRKAPRYSMGGAAAANRRNSVGGSMLQNPRLRKDDLHLHPINKITRGHQFNLPNPHQGKNNPKKPAMGLAPSRKPLSPVSPPSSKPNQRMPSRSRTPPQKTPGGPTSAPRATPTKPKSGGSEDHHYAAVTPEKMLSLAAASTPPSFSRPMQTITTPDTPFVPPAAARAACDVGEVLEYSFEELRAGYVGFAEEARQGNE